MTELALVRDSLQHEVVLPSGRLRIEIDRADWPLSRLCGFAARHNPRRGFLFVSKVLGKHWPSAPSEMALAQDTLAARLPPPTDRPVLFVGMAETATGLGQGVFESYLAQHGMGSAIYLQTTRYPLLGTQNLDFEERHSHAKSLHLYCPEQPALRHSFFQATTLILVDDELSTGQTFQSLVRAYQRVNPGIQHICLVSLTDFMGDEARLSWQSGAAQIDFVSLLSGALAFEPNPSFQAEPSAPAQAKVACRRDHTGFFSARLGTDRKVRLPSSLLDRVSASLPLTKPVWVLGTGEFMHPAFCLARDLCALGWDVRVQSTTRSPILLGADIQQCLTLQDPYGEGIPNYLYNVDPLGKSVLLCSENPPSRALSDTVNRLGAMLIDLRHEP